MYFLSHTISIPNYNTYIFSILVKINVKARKMAQMLKHLPGKPKNAVLILTTPINSACLWQPICNSSLRS